MAKRKSQLDRATKRIAAYCHGYFGNSGGTGSEEAFRMIIAETLLAATDADRRDARRYLAEIEAATKSMTARIRARETGEAPCAPS